MRSLINGQKIKIDNHKSGENVSKDISKVHFHKTFLSGNRKSKSMKIYLNGEKIDFDKNFNEDEKPRILNEIRSVLKKDEQKLREFAEEVGDALTRWSDGDISLENAQQYAKNIARLFSLRPEIEEEFIRQVRGQLLHYISIHKDELDKKYWISQNAKSISIGPGEISIQKRSKRT